MTRVTKVHVNNNKFNSQKLVFYFAPFSETGNDMGDILLTGICINCSTFQRNDPFLSQCYKIYCYRSCYRAAVTFFVELQSGLKRWSMCQWLIIIHHHFSTFSVYQATVSNEVRKCFFQTKMARMKCLHNFCINFLN